MDTTERILSYNPNFSSERSPNVDLDNRAESRSSNAKDGLLSKCKGVIEELTNEINLETNLNNLLKEQTCSFNNELQTIMEGVNLSKDHEQKKSEGLQNLNENMFEIENNLTKADEYMIQQNIDFDNTYSQNKQVKLDLANHKEVYDHLIKEINEKDLIYYKLKEDLGSFREVKNNNSPNEVFQQNQDLKQRYNDLCKVNQKLSKRHQEISEVCKINEADKVFETFQEQQKIDKNSRECLTSKIDEFKNAIASVKDEIFA